jgi:OTU-like cysteine protease
VQNGDGDESQSVQIGDGDESQSVQNGDGDESQSVQNIDGDESQSVQNGDGDESQRVQNGDESQSVKNGDGIDNGGKSKSCEINSQGDESVKKDDGDKSSQHDPATNCAELALKVETLQQLCSQLKIQLAELQVKISSPNCSCDTHRCNIPKQNKTQKMFDHIKEQLVEYNLEPEDVPADGNCQFTSVADQLEYENDPDFYRQAAVSFIAGSKSDFLESVLGIHSKQFDQSQNSHTLDKLKDCQDNYQNAVFSDYLSKMSKSGFFGDHCTLYALACYLKVNIIVHELNKPPFSMLDSSQGKSPTKCLHIVLQFPREHYLSTRKTSTSSFTPEGLPEKLSKMDTCKQGKFSSVFVEPRPMRRNVPNKNWSAPRIYSRRRSNVNNHLPMENRFFAFQTSDDSDIITIDDEEGDLTTSKNSNSPNAHQNHLRKQSSETQKSKEFQDICRSKNSASVDEFFRQFKETTPNSAGASELKSQKQPKKSESAQNQSTPHTDNQKPFQEWRTREIKTVPGATAVLYGDSIIRHITQHTTQMSTICLPGAKLFNMKKNLSDPEISSILRKADTIILHAGSNDMANQATTEEICLHMKRLINSVKELCPDSKISVSGILLRKHIPMHHTEYLNDSLSHMLKLEHIEFVDPNRRFRFKVSDGLAGDEIHLNPKGVAELANIFSTIHTKSENWKRHNFHPPRP